MKENEFVYVYFGRLHAPAKPDPAEIASLDFASLAEIADASSESRSPSRIG